MKMKIDLKLNCAMALACATIGTPAPAQTYDAAQTKSHCAEQWADDFNMQTYCARQIEEGFATYGTQRKTAATLDGFDPATLAACETQWSEQWNMVSYCAGQQINGLAEFQNTLTTLPEDIATQISDKCTRDWPDSHAMQAYCAGQQAEAWKSLE